MKVYVIEVGCFSDRSVYGVVENENSAKEICKRINEQSVYLNNARYTEFDTSFITVNQILYQVIFIGNEIDYIDIATTDYIKQDFNFYFCYKIEDDDGCMTIYLFAENDEVAKKTAYDIRTKYLAEKAGL